MAEMAAAYTLMVEASIKTRLEKRSTTGTGHCVGSCFCAWHHSQGKQKPPPVSVQRIGGGCPGAVDGLYNHWVTWP